MRRTNSPACGACTARANPAFGAPLTAALSKDPVSRLDLNCVAARGIFGFDDAGVFTIDAGRKPATAFFLELIARLQAIATVPMIDVRAYTRFL